MSDLEQKAIEMLDKIEAIAENYAPEVSELALQAVRVSAIGELLYGLISIISVPVIFVVGTRAAAFFKEKKKEDGMYSSWEVGIGMSFICTIIGCSVFAISGIQVLFNVWNWVAIFSPELALAHQITGL